MVPAVVYSPMIVLVGDPFATNRFEPDSAMLPGLLNPEMSEALTKVPEVVYSPTVPVVKSVTKMIPARAALLKSNNPSSTEVSSPQRFIVFSHPK